eukprot:TRINITY_DN867_c0_g1_i1.p1 TRINITY_DN867_c0_g1~~TRINITY_DN867_c0_g1_i1.p1  ORF type:complete len:520 (-),score=126.15 TRINITY_DN867_c0_g1_i1:34-1593(-)
MLYLLGLFLFGAIADNSIVQTIYGPIQGVVSGNYRKFEGVPYAQPPVNNLRFASPVPPTAWSSVLPTKQWQPGCPQNCDLPPHTCPHATSEDCLYLNVYTPVTNSSKPLAVMVFIHGGHFDQGSSGCLLYDGGKFVTQGDVILVTMSYRLGALGWLATDDLSGNYGFLDQQLALKWVQQNIKAFGGNPNQVTIFGQSAGGNSVRAHMVSPSSKGLFQQAIIQSDPVALPMQNLDQAQQLGTFVLKELGCNDTACLRTKSVADVLSVQILAEKQIFFGHPLTLFLPFCPIVDGVLIPNHIFDALGNGTINNIPLMIGTMSEDAFLFVYKAIKSKLNTVEYETALALLFGDIVLDLNSQYPAPLIGDKRPTFSVMGTDYIFTCPARHELDLINTKFPGTPTYMYQFNHVLSFDAWGPDFSFCAGHVCHGSEIPFEFDPPELHNYVNFTSAEQVLSGTIIDYFTNFAKNGNPNVGNPVSLNWPKWTPSTPTNLEFNTPNKLNTNLRKEHCDFWDQHGYHYGW